METEESENYAREDVQASKTLQSVSSRTSTQDLAHLQTGV